MSSIKEKKKAFREEVLSSRAKLTEALWSAKSEKIIKNLVGTDFFKQAATVHSYISMNKRREVCTDELFNIIFQNDKQAVVPITNFSDHTLTHSEITPNTNLETNKWGVREPDSVQVVDVSTLNLIVVPMVAADKKGNRLGYGQ
jgi:5-formyltetrahydrofolate cyclo-ligase